VALMSIRFMMRFLCVFCGGQRRSQQGCAGCHPQFQTNNKLYRSCECLD
jgi:hypothetical protein